MKHSRNSAIILNTKENDFGYKYIVNLGSIQSAYRTKKGFDYFMEHYGLEIDEDTVQHHNEGLKDGCTTFAFKPREIIISLFWNRDEVPRDAKLFIELENGSYVSCYSFKTQHKTFIYHPNCNAKNVYIPYDQKYISSYIYGED